MLSWRAIHRRFPWLDIPALVLIVVVGLLSFKYEDFKDDFPRLITWQLHTSQWITNLSPRKPHVEWVVPIEIDDRTFYDYLGNETRNALTDRKFLAELVEAAVSSKAAVIALDINLDEESFDRPQEGKTRPLNPDDQALLQAIREAQSAQIPVVLAFGFRHDMQPAPQIFDNETVSSAGVISYQFPEEEDPQRPWWVARFGFDNPGDDYRKVPLVTAGFDDQQRSVDYYSFALQTTDAYEHARNTPTPREKALADVFAQHEFVYTTFMPVDAFVNPELKIDDLHNGPISAVEIVCGPQPGKTWNAGVCTQLKDKRVAVAHGLLRGRIVLIGGNRHGYKDERGDEDYLDSHGSPVGPLRGMYLQANYIEGLLDNRVLFKVNRWLAAFIDVALAIGMLWIASRRSGVWKRVLVLLLLFIPALAAYFAAIVFSRCLDFLFPLVLLVLHPAIEGYLHLAHESHSEEIAHEEAAHHDTFDHRHVHTVRHSERRISGSERPADGSTDQQQHEEVVYESEEIDVDEEHDRRG
ncbi:MAG: CHASE2 domain-containing protein [Candidatus Korobacteraceae bacterium]